MNDQELKASVDLRENLISVNLTGVMSAKVGRQRSSCCDRQRNYIHVLSRDDINGA